MSILHKHQKIIIEHSEMFDNSFYKISKRQFGIFTTQKQKKEYIDYIVSYTLHNLNLSFVKKISYLKSKNNIEYQEEKGILIIPLNILMDSTNLIALIPYIASIVEYKNIYNYKKSENETLFIELLYKNYQTVFKTNITGIIPKVEPKYHPTLKRIDYTKNQALNYLSKLHSEKKIETITLPNIPQSWRVSLPDAILFVISFDRAFATFQINN